MIVLPCPLCDHEWLADRPGVRYRCRRCGTVIQTTGDPHTRIVIGADGTLVVETDGAGGGGGSGTSER